MPLIAAAVFDKTGSYNSAYLISAAMMAAAIVVTFLYKEKDWVHSQA